MAALRFIGEGLGLFRVYRGVALYTGADSGRFKFYTVVRAQVEPVPGLEELGGG